MYDNLTRTNLEFAYREAEKRIAQLEKENAELKEEMNAKQVVLNDFKSRVETVTGRFNKKSSQLTKAKEIILKLYNAGRDVLMCRAEEKAYDNLSNAINDRSIEKFLQEVSE